MRGEWGLVRALPVCFGCWESADAEYQISEEVSEEVSEEKKKKKQKRGEDCE